MASRKRKRLSALGVHARLGHPLRGGHGDDRNDIIEHVLDAVSRVTMRGDDGEPIRGDDDLVWVFESLGVGKTWPACGTPAWERLRTVALRTVVRRLARDGLLDRVSIGAGGTPARSRKGAATHRRCGRGSGQEEEEERAGSTRRDGP